MSEHLVIYTDGSCIPNPGKGGWGYIAVFPTHDIYNSGQEEYSTNNIMEMKAVIEALKYFNEYNKFHIYSDSLYVINCAKGVWQKKKNTELWKQYDKYSKGKTIIFTWVKGHSGDRYNELVDQLARNQI